MWLTINFCKAVVILDDFEVIFTSKSSFNVIIALHTLYIVTESQMKNLFRVGWTYLTPTPPLTWKAFMVRQLGKSYI